jgi:luciferase family oxidoreductase group 1
MPLMTAISVLDLSPITQGGDAARSFANSLSLAQHAESLGYKRFWLAEHHNMPGIASAATAVVIGHVAQGTSTIRVGSGGIMLPNHSPLTVAEAFGTLAAIHGPRIDLGVGRAPGTDQLTARALRRNLAGGAESFPQDVVELLYYFKDADPGQPVRAIPGVGLNVPVWILGSSLYGAQLAAMLGLPYAFASHFAPAELGPALHIYRERFQPSEHLDKPYAMVGLNVVAAETDDQARLLFSSQQQAFVNLRSGSPGPMPPPIENYEASLDSSARSMLAQTLRCSAIGSPQTVRDGLAAFVAETAADEVMITGPIFDHEARLRSFELVAQAARALA